MTMRLRLRLGCGCGGQTDSAPHWSFPITATMKSFCASGRY